MTSVGYRQVRRSGRAGALRIALWGLGGLLLLLPAAAMQFTSEVTWGVEDFLAAAVLIGGAGLATELAVRLLRAPAQRWVAISAVIAAALLVWAELAVGILG